MKLIQEANRQFGEFGLKCIGYHSIDAPSQKKNGVAKFITFDFEATNPDFFGHEYNGSIRFALMALIYEKLYGPAAGKYPGELFLDALVRLAGPYQADEPKIGHTQENSSVAVTTESNLEIVPLDMASDVDAKSMLACYARNYGAGAVLKDRGFYIAPDPITIELIEGICVAEPVTSVLELGAGLGTTGYVCKKNGIEDFTLVDLNPSTVAFMKQIHGEKAILADAFKFPLDRRYDVISIGTQYRFNPFFLDVRGKELAESCDYLIIQSGCTTFFEHENNWILGCLDPDWPWFKREQTIGNYFPNIRETMYGYQTAIIAGNKDLQSIQDNLALRGFKEPQYTRVMHD